VLEDVALLLQAPDALSELAQRLALGADQPVIALATVTLLLALAVAQRLRRHPRLAATSGIERP
jgi:hypothetical protein